MKNLFIIFMFSVLLFSCERNDMYEFASTGGIDLQITRGDSELFVSWNVITDAVNYQVWWSDVNDLPSAVLNSSDITSTNYTITGLANNTTYYVWLKVRKTAGGTAETVASGSGIPAIIPAAPSVSIAGVTSSDITIYWTASPGASAYEVWYGTSTNSADALRQGGDITSTGYTITGLSPATTYYMWLKAKSPAGISGFGIPSSQVTNP